jgi:signal transduction histidine kinase
MTITDTSAGDQLSILMIEGPRSEIVRIRRELHDDASPCLRSVIYHEGEYNSQLEAPPFPASRASSQLTTFSKLHTILTTAFAHARKLELRQENLPKKDSAIENPGTTRSST